MRAARMSAGRRIGGKEMSSWVRQAGEGEARGVEEREGGTHLEGLSVPVLDLVDGGHVAEVVGKLVELLYSVGEADGELLWEGMSAGRRGGGAEGAPRRNWLPLRSVP